MEKLPIEHTARVQGINVPVVWRIVGVWLYLATRPLWPSLFPVCV